MRDRLRLQCGEGREILRQIGGMRQGRVLDEDGNHSLAARERFAHVPPDEIVGIVEPPLAIAALGPEPSRAGHGQRVAAAHALVQHMLPVVTELDLIHSMKLWPSPNHSRSRSWINRALAGESSRR